MCGCKVVRGGLLGVNLKKISPPDVGVPGGYVFHVMDSLVYRILTGCASVSPSVTQLTHNNA